MSLRIHAYPSTPRAFKALVVANHLGVDYEFAFCDLMAGVQKSETFTALNPNQKMPVLEDGAFVLWESNAIMRYLATKHGAEKPYPSELKRRADVERWRAWSLGTLSPAITPMFLGLYRTPEPQRDKAAIEASRLKTADAVRILDAELAKHPYVSGDSFTLADIACGIFAGYRWFNFPIERPDFPNAKAWYERLTQRPAFKEHVMIGIT